MPFNYTTAMRLLKTDTPGPPFHITFVIPFNTLNIYIYVLHVVISIRNLTIGALLYF